MTSIFITVRAEDLVYRLNLDCIAYVVQDLTNFTVMVKMRDGRTFELDNQEAQPLLFVLDARFRHVQRQIEEADSEEVYRG